MRTLCLVVCEISHAYEGVQPLLHRALRLHYNDIRVTVICPS